MRHLSRPVGLMAGLALVGALAGPALAAAPGAGEPPSTAPPRTVHRLVTVSIPLAEAECTVMARTQHPAPGSRAGDGACAATVRLELDARRVEPDTDGAVGVALASSCTTTWIITSERATVQSIFGGFFWSASANATGYGDSCGRVMWTSVTCDQHGIGYSVRIDWCGAYPRRWVWYPYTTTDFGLNITLSAVANGVPISWTHGARNGFNPYTGSQYGFFAW